ncbi:DUF2695 domain-containing protein [Lysobacter sp. CCNWLW3]|uniref:DUF2695 domain-containing protein n=1 Tax=unclassified Lysobacter TaxID=2635362 RepID=UPI002FCEFD69
MNRPDAATRRALLKQWKQGQRQRARAEFPLDEVRLARFFDEVEALRARHGCFHDTRHAMRSIDAMALTDDEANALLDWCQRHGGHCDCEIAANTHQHWLESRDGATAAGSGRST